VASLRRVARRPIRFASATSGHGLIGAAALLALSATSALAIEVAACLHDSNVPSAVAEQLDSVLLAAVDVEGPLGSVLGAAPGAVLQLSAPGWQYARAAGVADPDTGAPITCEMPFQIGSNTKMMTATVILQLQEEAALSLDDPLSAHLPDIAAALPNGEAMTLRQLANHTAGVFSYTDDAPDGAPGIMDGGMSDPDILRRGYEMADLVQFVIEHGAPTFAPGADGQWAYSNTGYILLGMIIEAIENRPLAEVFETRIFDPLGMDDTLYWNDTPTADLGLPRAYLEAPFDVETSDWNMSQGAAAGAVISTAEDMHIFTRALIGGDLFAMPETLEAMQDTVLTGSPNIPAYGIGLAEKAPDVWGHGGQTLGFESDVALFADRDISLVGWATSSQNIMGLGVNAVTQALVSSGVLPDPTLAQYEALSDAVTGSEWQLTTVMDTTTGDTLTIDPARYSVAFRTPDDFSALADCNRVLGRWSLEAPALSIEPGPMTLALCAADSRSDAFIDWLTAVTEAQLDDTGNLILVSETGGDLTVLQFEPAP
jgi:D-alanyl-D-alanine carboxypeptidase